MEGGARFVERLWSDVRMGVVKAGKSHMRLVKLKNGNFVRAT